MTEESKDELRAILQSKQRNAACAADVVLKELASAQATLDLSEIALMFSRLMETLQASEGQVEAAAEAYERKEYGVELLNIDGQWDESLSVVDAQTKPWEQLDGSEQAGTEEAEATAPATTRTRLPSFGAATALLFDDQRGSVEIALAPLELRRILDAWSVYELSSNKPDAEVMRALHLLIGKSREKAPRLIAEVPIASSGRAALVPDLGYSSKMKQETRKENIEKA